MSAPTSVTTPSPASPTLSPSAALEVQPPCELLPGLWQGGLPVDFAWARRAGVEVVVDLSDADQRHAAQDVAGLAYRKQPLEDGTAMPEARMLDALVDDVVRHVRAGRPEAVQLVRDAGRTLGEVLAGIVNVLNPTVVVIGGDVAEAHEQLLAGVREVVYQRSLPLASRSLRIVRSQLGDRAGLVGTALQLADTIFAPERVEALVAG